MNAGSASACSGRSVESASLYVFVDVINLTSDMAENRRAKLRTVL